MPTSDSRDYDLIDRLAEEFAKRFRDGERPSVQEYCDKYPHIADDLRDMLPALAEVEQVKDEAQAPPTVEPPKLRQVDEYHILREVGRGGMGVVYEAEDTRLGRRVALKVLATGKAGHALERFKREARAAARLHHTNIVPVFGVGDHDGLPYYVMQFIQGLGLDEVLDEVKRLQAKSGSAVMPAAVSARPRRKDISAAAVARSLVTGTFEPPAQVEAAETLTHAPAVGTGLPAYANPAGLEACRHDGVSGSSISLPGRSNLSGRKLTYWQSVAQIGLQVADALDYAHKQGILHRDIKPSNLLLDLHGVVWVTDFGLAKAADQEDLTHTGDVLGTLRYMPPEAFEGKSEPRSDVYSLGLSLYELLALRPAYDERKKEQLVKQVTTTDPPRLGALSRAIPRDLQTIVHKAIEKDPDHRYRSAADLAADLRRFLGDLTILARRVSPTERFARWCKRNPTVAALSTAVFLLLLSVASVTSVLALRIEKKANEAQAEANRANDEADAASAARDAEAKERQRTQELLGDQFVHRGTGLLADGDPAGAALCFARALTLDPFDPEREATHRLRLAAALRDAPRPQHVLFHPAHVSTTAVSPDGKLLATGCDDGTVTVWDLATGKPVGGPLKHEHPVQQVAFTADGRRLWTSTRLQADRLRAGWDEFGEEVTAKPRSGLTLWDRAAGRVVESGQSFLLNGLPLPAVGPVERVGFMPAADRLEIRDAATGAPVGPVIQTEHPIYQWVASARARRVLVTTRRAEAWRRAEARKADSPRPLPDTQAGLWDPVTGKVVLPAIGVQSFVEVVFCGTNDGRVAGVEARGRSAVMWYDSGTGARLGRTAVGNIPNDGLTVSPDGRRVVAVGRSPTRGRITGRNTGTELVHVLNADTGEPVGPPFAVDLPDAGGGFVTGTLSRPVPNLDATRLLVSGRAIGSPQRLLRADGGPVPAQPGEVVVGSSKFSPDGGLLITVGGDNAVRAWDVWTGAPATPRMPHDGPVQRVDFTPDGSHVVVTCGHSVRVWPLARAEAATGPALDRTGRELYLSGDGRRLVEVSGAFIAFGRGEGPGSARVLDAATGQVLHGPVSLPAEDKDNIPVPWALATASVAVSVDGRAVLFTPRATIRKGKADDRADVQSRVLLWVCSTDHFKELVAVAGPVGPPEFSLDGRYARVQYSNAPGTTQARLFDAATGEPVGGVSVAAAAAAQTFGPARSVTNAGWTPDSSVVVVQDANGTTDTQMHIRDARSGVVLADPVPVPGARRAVRLTFDARGGRMLATRDARFGVAGQVAGEAHLWNVRTGRPVIAPLTAARTGGELTVATLSPGGDRIAVVVAPPQGGGRALPVRSRTDGLAVLLWDVAADRPVGPPLVHDRPVRLAEFSPTGDRLLTATDARQLRLWSVATGELLHVLTAAVPILTARFGDDGRRVVAQTGVDPGGPPGRAGPMQAWDARTGQPLTPSLRGPSSGFGGPVPRTTSGQHDSRNADRFLVERDDGTVGVFTLAGDDRPTVDLVELAELLSGRQVNPAGLVQGLGPAGFRAAWEARRDRFAADWAAALVAGLAWHRRVAAGSRGGVPTPRGRSTDRSGQTLWHLERLIAAEPNEARFHLQRAQAHVARGEHAAAAADFDRVIALDPNQPQGTYNTRASVRAELGDWAGAEADLVAASERATRKQGFSPTATVNPARTPLALVKLRRGDLPGFEAVCAELARNAHAERSSRSLLFLRYYYPALLRDGLDPDVKALLSTAEELRRLGNFTVPLGPFQLAPALRYRQGRYAEAEELFGETPPETPADYFFLAMARHRQGKPDARQALAKGIELQAQSAAGPTADLTVDSFLGTSPWQSRIVEDELRKEAEGLIGGKK